MSPATTIAAAVRVRTLRLGLLIACASLILGVHYMPDLNNLIGGCDTPTSPAPAKAEELADLTKLNEMAIGLFEEFLERRWIVPTDRALCIGADSGSAAAEAVMMDLGLPGAVGASATACCGLPFDYASFDFAFSAAVDRARVPARAILEMERVLRPGGTAAVIHLRSELMKAAAPIATLLRSSDVVVAHSVNGSSVVVFRKKIPGEGNDPGAPTAAAVVVGEECNFGKTKMPRLLYVLSVLSGYWLPLPS